MLLYSLPVAAVEANSNYDGLIHLARQGDSAPLLTWLQQNRDQLNSNRYADWLQVAS